MRAARHKGPQTSADSPGDDDDDNDNDDDDDNDNDDEQLHSGCVRCVRLCPPATHLVSVGWDGCVVLTDLQVMLIIMMMMMMT